MLHDAIMFAAGLVGGIIVFSWWWYRGGPREYLEAQMRSEFPTAIPMTGLHDEFCGYRMEVGGSAIMWFVAREAARQALHEGKPEEMIQPDMSKPPITIVEFLASELERSVKRFREAWPKTPDDQCKRCFGCGIEPHGTPDGYHPNLNGSCGSCGGSGMEPKRTVTSQGG